MSGLRLGELLALIWQDIDLDRGVITINKALKRSGFRTVMIPRYTVETLRQHKAEQIEQKQHSSGQYKDEGIVFATKLGFYANGHNITGRTI